MNKKKEKRKLSSGGGVAHHNYHVAATANEFGVHTCSNSDKVVIRRNYICYVCKVDLKNLEKEFYPWIASIRYATSVITFRSKRRKGNAQIAGSIMRSAVSKSTNNLEWRQLRQNNYLQTILHRNTRRRFARSLSGNMREFLRAQTAR